MRAATSASSGPLDAHADMGSLSDLEDDISPAAYQGIRFRRRRKTKMIGAMMARSPATSSFDGIREYREMLHIHSQRPVGRSYTAGSMRSDTDGDSPLRNRSSESLQYSPLPV